MIIIPYQSKYLNALKTIFFKNVPQYFDAQEWDAFEAFIQKESCPYHVMEEDDHILGSFGYAMDDEITGAIVWIFFDPDVHSKGIGRKAVEYCHDELRKLEAKEVVARTSQQTEGFFVRMGYEVHQRVKDYWAPGLDLVEVKSVL